MNPNVHCSIIYNSQDVDAAINAHCWMNGQDAGGVCVCVSVLFSR